MTRAQKLSDLAPEAVLEFPDDFPPGDADGPPPLLRRLPSERPVCPIRLPSGDRLWLVTSYSTVRLVMSDARFTRCLAFKGAPRFAGDDHTSVEGSMFNMDGADHSRVRRTIVGAFGRKAVDDCRPKVMAFATELADAMATRGGVHDLVYEFSGPFDQWITRGLLGIPGSLETRIRIAVQAQTDLRGDPERIGAATVELSSLARMLLDAVDTADEANPVACLVRARAAGIITVAEAVGTTALFLMAATDSLVPSLTAGLITLMSNAPIIAACVTDPSLWSRVADEVFRFHNNALTNFPRIAAADVALHDVLIRKGEGVLTSNLAACWDPAAIAEPERFAIDRAERSSIAFGVGRHTCPGARLARLVVAVAYESLVSRFPTLRLAVPLSEVDRTAERFFAWPKRVPVVW